MSLFAISYTIILHSSYYRTVPAIPEVSSRGLQPRLPILPHPKSLSREGLTTASGRRAGIFETEIRPYFLGAAAAPRARIIPITVCFPRRIQSSSGRYEGHVDWQHPHSMHEVIICCSNASQPFFCVIFER